MSSNIDFSQLSQTTLLQLMYNLLRQNQTKLDNFTIKISPECKNNLLILCNKEPGLFFDAEDSLQKIVADNEINSKDVPELINLINKIFQTITENKQLFTNIDIPQFIKTLLHILFLLFIEKRSNNKNHEENTKLIECALSIIDASMDLIKIPNIKPVKNLFNKLFKK